MYRCDLGKLTTTDTRAVCSIVTVYIYAMNSYTLQQLFHFQQDFTVSVHMPSAPLTAMAINLFQLKCCFNFCSDLHQINVKNARSGAQ